MIRLRDLGLDDFLIAATLRGVIAQRLLRRLCITCRQPYSPTQIERDQFAKHDMYPPAELCEALGCETCGGSGYAGRVGIFEMIEVGESLRAAIDRGASETELRGIALNTNETLIGQGLEQVSLGNTSFSETMRVVGDVA